LYTVELTTSAVNVYGERLERSGTHRN